MQALNDIRAHYPLSKDDLNANREGRLGPGQLPHWREHIRREQRETLRQFGLFALVFGGIGAALTTFSTVRGREDAALLFIVLIGGLLLIVGANVALYLLRLGWRMRRLAELSVQRHEGILRVVAETDDERRRYLIGVDRLWLMTNVDAPKLNPGPDEPPSIDLGASDIPYRVYTLQLRPRPDEPHWLLGLEPLSNR